MLERADHKYDATPSEFGKSDVLEFAVTEAHVAGLSKGIGDCVIE